MGALSLGSAPALAQFRLEPTLGISETYSDNVDQEPDGQETDAFLTDVTPGTTLRWSGGRTTAALDLAITGRHQTSGADKGVEVLPDVGATASSELVQDHLFIDASAAVGLELLNTRQQNTTANNTIVQTYSAGPRLANRFGSFADGQAFYRFNQVIDDDSNSLGDDTEHTIGVGLSAGPDFTVLRWSLNGEASRTQRDTLHDITETDSSLGLEYIVDRNFSLLGSVGYQTYDEGNAANDFDSISWDAGFRWQPGPRTDITATYGERDNTKSFAGDLRYAISPQTSLFATYAEDLETGQDRLNQDLSFLTVDPNTGNLINSRTGQPFNNSTAITTIDNTTRRVKTLTVGLNGTRGRNNFGISGIAQRSREQGAVGAANDEDAYSVGLNFGRQLTPDSSLGFNASYARNKFKIDGRRDDEYSAGVSYSYNIFRNISAVGAYSYTEQNSTLAVDEFVENQVSIGVNMSF